MSIPAHSAPLGITFYDWRDASRGEGEYPNGSGGSTLASLSNRPNPNSHPCTLLVARWEGRGGVKRRRSQCRRTICREN